MVGAILKASMLWVRKEKKQKSSRLAVTIRKDNTVQNLVSRMICRDKGGAHSVSWRLLVPSSIWPLIPNSSPAPREIIPQP